MKRSIGLFAFAALAVPSIAAAQPRESGFSAELSYYHFRGSGDANGGLLDLGGIFSFGSFGVGAEWGGTLFSANSGGTVQVRAYNPFLGAYYFVGLPLAQLRVGAGVALPIANIDNSNLVNAITDQLVLAGAAASHGLWNSWLYLPNTLTVVVPARLTLDLEVLKVAGEAGIGMAVGTGNNRGNDFIYQLAAEAFVSVGVEPGLRLQWVHIPTASVMGDNNFQSSLEPFVRFGAGPVHIMASLTYNLNTPLGPSLTRDGSVIALHAGANISF
jgi:hypothetical protein